MANSSVSENFIFLDRGRKFIGILCSGDWFIRVDTLRRFVFFYDALLERDEWKWVSMLMSLLTLILVDEKILENVARNWSFCGVFVILHNFLGRMSRG